jgi:translation initiation factor IF-1
MKKEEILLDATLVDALDCATFQARLANGHEIVAFTAPKHRAVELGLRVGQNVRVNLSPYDMLKGRIITDPKQDLTS